MTINKTNENGTLNIKVTGRIDSMTAPELEASVKESMGDVQAIDFDFAELDYISSAGLRVLLGTQKLMNQKGGEMVIRNCGEQILEVFEITGFTSILNLA